MKKITKSILSFFSTKSTQTKLVTFTPEWLMENAVAQSRKDFEESAKLLNATPMYHATEMESAVTIVATKKIYGIDVVSAAHFHHRPDGAIRQAQKSGVYLGFFWSGEVVQVDLALNDTTHADRRPNILFDVPIEKVGGETWELRLYPGTTGLLLAYFEVGGNGYRLNTPVALSVIPA